MASVIEDEEQDLPDKSQYILSQEVKGGHGRIELIPSSIALADIDISLVNVMGRENILKLVLSNMKNEYDYIILDCMPSLGMMTINALIACTRVLIPAAPQYLSAKGLELLLKTIGKVKRRTNPDIEIDGILITMNNERTKLAKEIHNMITEAYGQHIRVYENKIPTSVKVGESNYSSKSILEYDSRGKVAVAYRNFLEEFLS
jgi:chromosome partitioning protein